MPFELIRQDITRMETDAIVNAANPQLREGGGVCGAIFRAAGAAEMEAACKKLRPIQVGEAVSTPGFRLPAQTVIHTAGPVWQGGQKGEERLLRASYWNSLLLADQLGCTSIAFPLLSSGIYGYPKDLALRVAVSVIEEYLRGSELKIYLIVFDKEAFRMSRRHFLEIEAFIDENYAAQQEQSFSRRALAEEEFSFGSVRESVPLDDLLEEAEEPFSVRLIRMIDERGQADPQVYKKANIDRKLFSKIKNSPDYMPSKRTAVAFAVALELNLRETEELLESAGYALSRSSKADLIYRFFIENGNYSIFDINEALFLYDEPVLGS